MRNGIVGLDHVIIAVTDLEASAERWRKHGFTVTPRGRHTGKSTGNYCIMFENSYIELLGIVDRSLPIPDFAPRSAESEGMTGIVFAHNGVETVISSLDTNGIKHSGAQQLERDLELPSGTVRPRFTNVFLHPEDLPGFQCFFCQHETPELTRKEAEWMSHPNGASDITEVFLVEPEPQKLREGCERLFGPVISEDDGFSVSLGHATLRILKPSHWQAVCPSVDVEQVQRAPLFAGLTITMSAGSQMLLPSHANNVVVQLLSH